jgi:hypothetical protein
MAKCPHCDAPATASGMTRLTRRDEYRCGRCQELSLVMLRGPVGVAWLAIALFVPACWTAVSFWESGVARMAFAMVVAGVGVWASAVVMARWGRLAPPRATPPR